MRVRSEPIVLGILTGAFMFLATYLAVLVGGCAHAAPRPTPTQARRLDTQVATAVVVDTECGAGSGVLLDSTRVLTAHHVIDCDRSETKVRLATTVKVKTLDGKIFVAAYDALDVERDLARLRLPNAIANVSPLTVARTLGRGQIVCATTAAPTREIRCGVIGDKPGINRAYGDIHVDKVDLWLGNSGSPLYNTSGELVGVVVRMYFCNDIDAQFWEHVHIKPEHTCGGRATTVEGPVLP